MRLRFVLLAAGALALPTLALASNGEPKEAFTPAGQAIAKRVALTKTDLPMGSSGYVSTGASLATMTCPAYKSGRSGLTKLTVTGKYVVDFDVAGASAPFITFFALVFLSPSQATTYFDQDLASETKCFAWSLIRDPPVSGMKSTLVSQKLTPLPGLGEKAWVFTVVTDSTLGARKSRQQIDSYYIRKGALDVFFSVVTNGGPYAGGAALAQKLASRMP